MILYSLDLESSYASVQKAGGGGGGHDHHRDRFVSRWPTLKVLRPLRERTGGMIRPNTSGRQRRLSSIPIVAFRVGTDAIPRHDGFRRPTDVISLRAGACDRAGIALRVDMRENHRRVVTDDFFSSIRGETMATGIDRRELAFRNLDEVLADVQQLASGEFRTTGNHTFGQILNHLALSQDVSAGRIEAPPPPFFMKLMMPIMRRMVINSKPLKPGIKLPQQGESFFWPDKEFDVPSALEYFRDSVAYYNDNGPLEVHPFFGRLTKEDADALTCRHAALHLSFVHPA